jgi:hypothetical protein
MGRTIPAPSPEESGVTPEQKRLLDQLAAGLRDQSPDRLDAFLDCLEDDQGGADPGDDAPTNTVNSVPRTEEV